MRVCLMIEGQEGVTWEQWVALAEACERHGIEALVRSDHYVSNVDREERGSLDAWATLAALASVTRRIRLGSMVSPATFRHPSVLAKMATTVDHISGGRVELGLGAGWQEREHRAYGFSFPPMSERVKLMAEQLEVIHRQWTEDVVDFEGPTYRLEQLRALPKPLQQPHPWIIVGGSALPGTAVPAARFADEYNTLLTSFDGARRRRARLREACVSLGRDPDSLLFSIHTSFLLGASETEVTERALRTMERMNVAGDAEEFVRKRRHLWLVGTPDDGAARLAALADLGVERVFLQHFDHEDLDAIELVAQAARSDAPATERRS